MKDKRPSFFSHFVGNHIVIAIPVTMMMLLYSELISLIVFPILWLVMNALLLPVSLLSAILIKITPIKFQKSKLRLLVVLLIATTVVLLFPKINRNNEWKKEFDKLYVEHPGELIELIEYKKHPDLDEPLELIYITNCENNVRLIKKVGFNNPNYLVDKINCTNLNEDKYTCFRSHSTSIDNKKICLYPGFKKASVIWD